MGWDGIKIVTSFHVTGVLCLVGNSLPHLYPCQFLGWFTQQAQGLVCLFRRSAVTGPFQHPFRDEFLFTSLPAVFAFTGENRKRKREGKALKKS